MFNIERFKKGYDRYFLEAKKQIENGQKCSHWMWFIFPQVKGLGHSSISQYYGMSGSEEAKAFFNDKELRKQLLALTKCVLRLKDKDILVKCFGPIDTLKLHSSMTLFWLSTWNRNFKKVLKKFYNNAYCEKTVKLLAEGACK